MGLYSGYCCDKCGAAAEYRRSANEWLPSKTYIITWARKSGWSVGKSVLCPECKRRKSK